MLLSKEISAKGKYLNLPICTGAEAKHVSIFADGKVVHDFMAELSSEKPDFWMFVSFDWYADNTLTLTVESDDERLLEMIYVSDEIMHGELYKEKYRPQYHFTSKMGWINDPVGLHYHKGKYHMFYQHNPYGVKWGNMHWGYAISEDLVRWNEVKDTLLPDKTGTMWSGSGVVDSQNTAELSENDEEAQILIYTAAGGTSLISEGQPFTQCLAYSIDNGESWIKYDGNPVLDNISIKNRDPKVFWHHESNRWIMALYIEKSSYALFSSPNLKEWELICNIEMPGCDECPDFFEISVEGSDSEKKWIFWAATRGAYVVGSFDGKNFEKESTALYAVPEGANFYAAQTWNNIPEKDGRRIQIGWANFDIPDMSFNGFLTFPCELNLKNTKKGLRLFFNPIEELKSLYKKEYVYKNIEILKDVIYEDIICKQLDIQVEFEVSLSESFGIEIFGTRITYDVKERKLSCLGVTGKLESNNSEIKMRILVDTTSLEIYADGGGLYIPVGVIHKKPEDGLRIFTDGGKTIVKSLEIIELESIWK